MIQRTVMRVLRRNMVVTHSVITQVQAAEAVVEVAQGLLDVIYIL